MLFRSGGVYLCLGDPGEAEERGRLIRTFPGLEEGAPVVIIDEAVGAAARDPAPGLTVFPFYASTCFIQAILQEPQDSLARALHWHSGEMQRRSGIPAAGDPARAPWERLRGDLKERFRSQADHLPFQVAAIGGSLGPRGGPGRPVSPGPADILLMARMEHRRQVVERILSTWRPDQSLLALRRAEEPLPAWESLSAGEQGEVQARVAVLAEVLEMAGQQICRGPAAGPA